jgi:hypothetical protein
MIDALERRDFPDVDTILGLWRSLKPDETWLEIFLIELVGARQIRQAIPDLIDRFDCEGDFLIEEFNRPSSGSATPKQSGSSANATPRPPRISSFRS